MIYRKRDTKWDRKGYEKRGRKGERKNDRKRYRKRYVYENGIEKSDKKKARRKNDHRYRKLEKGKIINLLIKWKDNSIYQYFKIGCLIFLIILPIIPINIFKMDIERKEERDIEKSRETYREK